VDGVAREVGLARFERPLEGGLEQRVRGLRVAARAEHPASLELQADGRYGVRSSERLGLVQQLFARVEVAAKALDARKLREHLGTPGIGFLFLELLPEPPLALLDVAEIPQGTHPIGHGRTVLRGVGRASATSKPQVGPLP
jgi:hypothetical protein